VCWSGVLQCVAMCCNVVEHTTGWSSAMRRSTLQCSAACCSCMLQRVAVRCSTYEVRAQALQCVAVCCSGVLQCVAVWCSVLQQCVAVCGSTCGVTAQTLQFVNGIHVPLRCLWKVCESFTSWNLDDSLRQWHVDDAVCSWVTSSSPCGVCKEFVTNLVCDI